MPLYGGFGGLRSLSSGTAVLDLNYAEDSHAVVDCNVMTSKGEFIEVSWHGRSRPFTRNELDQLLTLGEQGCPDCARSREACSANKRETKHEICTGIP